MLKCHLIRSFPDLTLSGTLPSSPSRLLFWSYSTWNYVTMFVYLIIFYLPHYNIRSRRQGFFPLALCCFPVPRIVPGTSQSHSDYSLGVSRNRWTSKQNYSSYMCEAVILRPSLHANINACSGENATGNLFNAWMNMFVKDLRPCPEFYIMLGTLHLPLMFFWFTYWLFSVIYPEWWLSRWGYIRSKIACFDVISVSKARVQER